MRVKSKVIVFLVFALLILTMFSSCSSQDEEGEQDSDKGPEELVPYQINEPITKDKIEITVTSVQEYDVILEATPIIGYTYVAVHFQYRNITDNDLIWEEFPIVKLVQIQPPIYVDEEYSYIEYEFDVEATSLYCVEVAETTEEALDNLPANTIREDFEVFLVDSAEYTQGNIYVIFDMFDEIVKVK